MQNVPAPPDVDRLISGGKARQHRRNRRRTAWVGVAAAVVVAGGVYGVARSQAGTTDHPGPAQPPPTVNSSPSATMRDFQMLVGDDASGNSIHADVTLVGEWGMSEFPVLSDSTNRYGGLAVYRPDFLAAGNGCLSHQPNPHVGHTPQTLAQQLAHLPRSTVLQSPTPTQRFGRHAIHLQLRINPDCGRSVYRVAETIQGGHGISYGKSSRHVLIDFWVENVRGAPVVVETWHQEGASAQLVNQIARSVRSLTFVTGQ
jgi:hypothetical protein